MNDTYKVRHIGGALLVTIPQYIARTLGLSKGDEVKIEYVAGSHGEIVIRRAVKPSVKRRGK